MTTLTPAEVDEVQEHYLRVWLARRRREDFAQRAAHSHEMTKARHARFRAARRERQAEATQAALKAQALAKLTDAEREALGLC